MTITLNGTTGITTPDVTADSGESLTSRVAKSGDTMSGALNLVTAGFSGGVRSTATTGDTTSRWKISRNTSTGQSGKDWFLSCNTDTGGFALHEGSVGDALLVLPGGRVTMPYQPMFEAYTSSNITMPSGADTKATFNSTTENVGGHYSTTTGRFTAPVSGVYLFYVCGTLYSGTTDQYITMHLKKNGSDFGAYGRENSYGGQYGSAPVVKVGSLAAGDYVELWVYSQTGNAYVHGGECKFGGYLLG